MKKSDITMKLAEYIKNKGGTWKLTRYETEKLGSLSDCLQAATPGHKSIPPLGHSAAYFGNIDKQMAEFIAHCSENYWGGNPIFKEIASQLYDDMRKIIEKYMAKH